MASAGPQPSCAIAHSANVASIPAKARIARKKIPSSRASTLRPNASRKASTRLRRGRIANPAGRLSFSTKTQPRNAISDKPQAISPGTAMPSGLFRHEGDHWVFAGPTPDVFKGYTGDHVQLLVRYMFQFTPEELHQLIQKLPARGSSK